MTPIDDDELRAMLQARGDRHAIDLRIVGEVARRDAASAARTDGRRSPIRSVLAALGSVAAIALALLVVVVPLSLRPAASAAPSTHASPQVGPSAGAPTPTQSPAAGVDRYPGGIPRVIDGEPVLIGLDAQARWRDAIDATPFLVGGWFDSQFLAICSGGIGPADPHPLAARGCPRYDVDGMPGRPIYPEPFVMPEGDGPIVLRVHTRDPGAATCTAVYIDECSRRVVVEAVAWFGDASTAAAPLGPRRAISRATSVFVMESRHRPDGEYAVEEDVFTVPLACPAPWPLLLFSIHGDPRYGLIAAFPDPRARERFQGSIEPEAAVECLRPLIERPAEPRWVGHHNVLVLAYADDAFAARLASVLQGPQPDQKALPMTEPELDRSLETVSDYLVSRAAGSLDHAWGERLIHPIFEDPGGPRDVVADAYGAWMADVFRRRAADALVGRIEALDDEPTQARIGPTAWRVVQESDVTRSRIFRVTYPAAADPALAIEEFLVIQMPQSLFREWQLIRIAGEPYPLDPEILTIRRVEPSSGLTSGGSGDMPCIPAGQECGP